MELPYEIWEKIIVELKNVKQCIKLFNSFPRTIQKYIRNTFDTHMESIQTKILYSFENCLFLQIENNKEIIKIDDDIYNEIQFVRVMNNGYIVSVDKKGKIIFWDSKKYEYIDCIEIDNEIQNIEFHPTAA